MKNRRTESGATIALVVAVIAVLALIGFGSVFMMQYFGSHEQTQHAADAGTLSAARNVLTQVNAQLPPGDAAQFEGIADGGKFVNLMNYNKVMAQAFLVATNAEVMAGKGEDGGTARQHAKSIVEAANSVGDVLTGQITSTHNQTVNQLFTALANANPMGEASENGKLSPSGPVKTAYFNSGDPSNVFIVPQQLADSNGSATSPLLRDSGWTTSLSGKTFFKGYADGITPSPGAGSIYFIPLRPGAQPRLVSHNEFSNKSTRQGFNWDHAVPNALGMSATATSTQTQTQSTFEACAVIQPIDPNGIQASLPHGFIRLKNGPASPASGSSASNSVDAFTWCMDHPQYYVTDAGGNALPYFLSVDTPSGELPDGGDALSYIQTIIKANNEGTTTSRTCSGLNVGYQLSGDASVGLGGVSLANCKRIQGVAMNGGTVGSYTPPDSTANGSTSSSSFSGGANGAGYNNKDLDTPAGSSGPGSGQMNSVMGQYTNQSATLTAELASRHIPGLKALPLIEQAYGLQPPHAVSSGSVSVHVADQINLWFLSMRADGQDADFSTWKPDDKRWQSGIADFPGTRGSLGNGDYRVAGDGAKLGAYINSGNSPDMWAYLLQRCYEIYPGFNGNLSALLNSNDVPMGGRAYIYYKPSAGGMVLESEETALSQSPWLNKYIAEDADGKAPVSPTDMVSGGRLSGDQNFDMSGDWGFPHPYDAEGADICVVNWFAFTPSSGWHNLLGEVAMGAFGMMCGGCPYDKPHYATYKILPNGTGGNLLQLPNNCGGCKVNCSWTGLC